jgi:ComF family protein
MWFDMLCAGCDRPGQAICPSCRFALLTHRVRRPAVPGDGDVIAAIAFTGRARDVVLALKYRNRRAIGRHLAGLLVNRLIETGAIADLDVVTWAPTSGTRRRHRGFDQGEVIARTVARQLGLPCRRLLDRRGTTRAQTGRSRSERLHAPSFVAHPGVAGRRVLVVDDVVTTGATLRAAGDAVSHAGAFGVVLAAVAATPDVRGGNRCDVPMRTTGPTAAPAVRPPSAA